MNKCKHPEVWPDGNCVDCGVLATLFPGKSDAHIMVPRSEERSDHVYTEHPTYTGSHCAVCGKPKNRHKQKERV